MTVMAGGLSCDMNHKICDSILLPGKFLYSCSLSKLSEATW